MRSILHRIGLALYASRLVDWFIECFGKYQFTSQKQERIFRFYEEATELVQAAGMSEEDCLAMVKLVYSKPKGMVEQEVGGAYTTLLIFCESSGLSLAGCGEMELKRIKSKIPLIREKQKAKLHPKSYHGCNTNLPPEYPSDTSKIKPPPKKP